MKIHNKLSSQILNKGIYCIKNTITNKVYIGSTTVKFVIRLQRHIRDLENHRHFNKHLQASWDRYNPEAFEFRILFICSNNIYHWEHRAIKLTKALNPKYGYNKNSNINKPPVPSKESRKKQGKSIKKTNVISRKYLKQLNAGEITFDEIPFEYNGLARTSRASKKHMTGKKYEDTSHFKVPHTITEAFLEGRKNYSEYLREKAPQIEVLAFNGVSLGIFRSSKDIEDMSKVSPNLFTDFVGGRFSKPRRGKNVDYLNSASINKAIFKCRLYKGLEFRKIEVPSSQEID